MKLVISVEGGIVQDISGLREEVEDTLEMVIVDYDTDGILEDELVRWEDPDGQSQVARVFGEAINFDNKKWVEKAFALAG